MSKNKSIYQKHRENNTGDRNTGIKGIGDQSRQWRQLIKEFEMMEDKRS